jgi:hypothetical protein
MGAAGDGHGGQREYRRHPHRVDVQQDRGTIRRHGQGAQPYPTGVGVTAIARAFGGLSTADWALAGTVDHDAAWFTHDACRLNSIRAPHPHWVRTARAGGRNLK